MTKPGLITPFCPRNAKKGFTLIELMVAASIMGIIGLTILATFGSGLHVYERIQSFGGDQADVLLALEAMEKDLKNTFPFLTIPIEGDTQSVAFPAVVETTEDIDGEDQSVMNIGKVSYFVEDAVYVGGAKKRLMRAEQNYSQAVSGGDPEAGQEDALAEVEDLSFEYYYYSEETEEYGWQSSWSKDEVAVLKGVKIAVAYKDGADDVELERTVIIPTLQKVIGLEEDEVAAPEEDDDDE